MFFPALRYLNMMTQSGSETCYVFIQMMNNAKIVFPHNFAKAQQLNNLIINIT